MDNDRSMIEQHARNTRFVLFETISAGHQYLKITNVSISIRCEGFGLVSGRNIRSKSKPGSGLAPGFIVSERTVLAYGVPAFPKSGYMMF